MDTTAAYELTLFIDRARANGWRDVAEHDDN